MNRKHAAYLAVIVALALINLWRWGVFSSSDKHEGQRGKALAAEDFRLRLDASVPGQPLRDLFNSGGGGHFVASGPLRPKSALTKAVVQIPPPEMATNPAADADLGKLRLLGVVFRGSKGQAYLAFDRENVIAQSGETVLGRFAVARIGVDAVELTDLRTNASRRIPVSGK